MADKQSVFTARSHYQSRKWRHRTGRHRQRATAGLPTATDTLPNLIKVGRKLIKDVRFADDQGMTAASEGGLQKLMDGLNRTSKEYDMKVNTKKTKVVKVSRKGEGEIKITIDGERLEQVDQFRYQGD